MLGILRCLLSHTRLSVDGASLVSETGERHPLVNGKPVMVKNVATTHGSLSATVTPRVWN